MGPHGRHKGWYEAVGVHCLYSTNDGGSTVCLQAFLNSKISLFLRSVRLMLRFNYWAEWDMLSYWQLDTVLATLHNDLTSSVVDRFAQGNHYLIRSQVFIQPTQTLAHAVVIFKKQVALLPVSSPGRLASSQLVGGHSIIVHYVTKKLGKSLGTMLASTWCCLYN